MLIDEILSNKSWKKTGVIDSLRRRLAAAPKFVLRRDFAMAIDEIVHNNWTENCNKVVPLCRLPYRECWIEVAQNDRYAHRRHIVIRDNENKTKRIGWLLTEIDDRGVWVAQMFWSFDTSDLKFQETVAKLGPDFWSTCPLSGATTKILFNPSAKKALEAIGVYGPSDFSINVVNLDKTYAAKLDFSGTMTDWEGEGTFLMGVLSLLNSKNVVEFTPVSFAKKNKAAVKDGRLPLFEYHEISIHQRYTKRNMDPATAGDGKKFRFHWCRGHFKVRKTGVFFWSSHGRGDPKLGSIGKDYHVDL